MGEKLFFEWWPVFLTLFAALFHPLYAQSNGDSTSRRGVNLRQTWEREISESLISMGMDRHSREFIGRGYRAFDGGAE
jgi:hypothetical protein